MAPSKQFLFEYEYGNHVFQIQTTTQIKALCITSALIELVRLMERCSFTVRSVSSKLANKQQCLFVEQDFEEFEGLELVVKEDKRVQFQTDFHSFEVILEKGSIVFNNLTESDHTEHKIAV